MPSFRKVKNLLIFTFSLVFLLSITFFINTAFGQSGDTAPPVTSLLQNPSSPNGKNGWYVTPVHFTLQATDLESGVKEINYRINGGNWVTTSFSNTENLVQNPSLETTGNTSTGIENWEATVIDPEGAYQQDSTSAPSFPNHSAKITALGGSWHGINNKNSYAPAVPYDNMTASAWFRTQDVTGSAYFKIYAVIPSGENTFTYQELAQSNTLKGSNGWTKVSLNYTVTAANAVGVYIDLGLSGPGSIWVDAVNISSSATSTQTSLTIATDREPNTLEYYSVDNNNNIEFHSCLSPITNCVSFKLDQTPPGNWNNSGAYRGLFGSSHELYVYTNVEDDMSGLSVFTDRYQYKVDAQPTFGHYPNILSCNGTWQQNQWVFLITPPFSPGANSAYLITPKTDFCNSNWKVCKVVRFYAEDLAGNSETKDFCINGPWIRLSGGGTVRSNSYIDMLSEPVDDNTDALIEVGGNTIDFFTSSKNWKVRFSPTPRKNNYQRFDEMVNNEITLQNTASLPTTTGAYKISGDYTITNQRIPNNFSSATFDIIVFIDGNLRITRDLNISNSSTALFIVSGNVEVDRNVNLIDSGIFSDGYFYTAYNATENQNSNTLVLRGIFSAEKFVFQRTLQGTNNATIPSEDFIYEPKYVIQTKRFMNNSSVTWLQ